MTYYISVSTTNGKTVIEGTLAEFNQVLEASFDTCDKLVDALIEDNELLERFYIDEWGIGEITYSTTQPNSYDYYCSVADIVADMEQ